MLGSIFLQISNDTQYLASELTKTINNSDNSNLFLQYVLTLAVIATAFITFYYNRKTHEQTEKHLKFTKNELEHRLKAILDFTPSETGVFKKEENMFQTRGILTNRGSIPSSKINVYFSRVKSTTWKIDELLNEWKKIKINSIPIAGSIIPNKEKSFMSGNLKRVGEGQNYVAMWITFEYGENTADETIWTIKLNGSIHTIEDTFLKSDIEKARKEPADKADF